MSDVELTEGERLEMEATREALQDVYGTATNIKSFREGEAMLAEGRKTMMDAIQMLPEDQRKAYDEATSECPHLVEMESNPERFLRACDYNPWQAAQHLATYWNKRKEIFGPQRAFLKMDLSGDGAVPKDVADAILDCGGTILLPSDGKKRAVFYSERARLCVRCCEEDARLMTFFYTLQSIFQNDEALVHGYVIITTMDTNENDGTKKNNTPRSKITSFLQSGAIPVTLRAAHIVVMRKRSILESAIPIWLKVMGRMKALSLRTVVHFAETKENLLNDLKQYFLEEENLPQELGGKLGFDEYFRSWTADRLRQERSRYPASGGSAAAVSPDRKLTPREKNAQQNSPLNETSQNISEEKEEVKKDDTESVHASLVGAALEQLAAAADRARVDEAKTRKRRLDAIYQKKKREQRKVDFAKLTQELDSLQNDNVSLKKQRSFLESLLERATSMVQAYEQPSSLNQPQAAYPLQVPSVAGATASSSPAQPGSGPGEVGLDQQRILEMLPGLQAAGVDGGSSESALLQRLHPILQQQQQEQQAQQLLQHQQLQQQLLQQQLGQLSQRNSRSDRTHSPPPPQQQQQQTALNETAALRQLMEGAAVQSALHNLQSSGQQNNLQQQQQRLSATDLSGLLQSQNSSSGGSPAAAASLANPYLQQQQRQQNLHQPLSNQPQLSGVSSTWSSSSLSFNIGSSGDGRRNQPLGVPAPAGLSPPTVPNLQQQLVNPQGQGQAQQLQLSSSASSALFNFGGQPSTGIQQSPSQDPLFQQQQQQQHQQQQAQAPGTLQSFLESWQRSRS